MKRNGAAKDVDKVIKEVSDLKAKHGKQFEYIFDKVLECLVDVRMDAVIEDVIFEHENKNRKA